MMGTLVIVIDDLPTVRKIIEASLRRKGLDAVSFPDGIEALWSVAHQQLARIPNLLFLDEEQLYSGERDGKT